jgi:hypothetical protein
MRSVSLAAGLILVPAVTAWAQTPITIFGNAIPQNPVIPDSAVTLGVKFYSTQAGTIAGIRFYRGQTDSRGYTVKLFSSSGTLLGSATAAADTCSVPCWEQINFASPISIAANTTYVAAYYASNGDYADDTGTSGGLTNGASNGPLIVPASGQVGGNGVYTYSRGFPNQTWQDSNYYVDVSFTPAAGAPPTLSLSFSPSSPSVAYNAPGGTVVTTATASWSDGSPFTGTYSFSQPYSNDGGVFALNGNQIIVNPNGPGLSADANTTQNITVIATQ